MEDIIIVVWIAMIVLGSIINAANKRRQKGEPSEPEEEPAQPARPIVIRVPAPRTEKPYGEAQSLEGESLETIAPEGSFKAIFKPKAPQRPKAATPQHKTVSKAKTEKLTPTVTAHREEKHELARDFDLERAVVYSEILKPKYQEYE